ncbi:MAG: hypothetical protein ACK524_16735 [Planctomyces sp.]
MTEPETAELRRARSVVAAEFSSEAGLSRSEYSPVTRGILGRLTGGRASVMPMAEPTAASAVPSRPTKSAAASAVVLPPTKPPDCRSSRRNRCGTAD